MSDEPSDAPTGGEITIKITDEGISYTTDYTLPELVFWLRITEAMVVGRVLEQG